MRATVLRIKGSLERAVATTSRNWRNSTPPHLLASRTSSQGQSRVITLPPTLLFAVSTQEKRHQASRSMESASFPPAQIPTHFCDLLSRASSHGPGFKVDAKSVEIVREPVDFFNSLVERIKTAKKRIMLSSLYIGAEPKAMQMLQILDETMATNPDLEVTIVLDCLRGSRNTASPATAEFMPHPGSPHEGTLSSVSILFPLELKYPDRFKAFYYHTPKLHGVLKAILPERYNELVGVQHTKCYMIDDDVLISGANLSEQYFTNRQDRYVWIRNNSALASFYQNLLETICSFSFAIHSSNGQLVYPNTVPNPTVDPKSFNEIARDKLEALLQPRIEISASSSTGLPETLDGSSLLKTHDTWVFPTLQLGHANVTHDEALTEFILAHQPTVDQSQGYTTYMTSPYFNIADRYATAMMKCHGKPFRLIVASPKANGFFNGSGVSGMVPWAYDTVLKDWILALPRDSNIHVHEYVREGWTFHAKGLWIEMNQDGQPPDQSSSATSSSSSSTASDASIASSSSRVSSSTSPSSSEQTRTIGRPTASFTLVGSSNFGVRSMKRDLETQLAIFTTNEDLSRRLREEREYIFQGAQEVTPQTFEQRADNHSSMLRFVIPFATKYM